MNWSGQAGGIGNCAPAAEADEAMNTASTVAASSKAERETRAITTTRGEGRGGERERAASE